MRSRHGRSQRGRVRYTPTATGDCIVTRHGGRSSVAPTGRRASLHTDSSCPKRTAQLLVSESARTGGTQVSAFSPIRLLHPYSRLRRRPATNRIIVDSKGRTTL